MSAPNETTCNITPLMNMPAPNETTCVDVELTYEAFKLPSVTANAAQLKHADERKAYFGPLSTKQQSIADLKLATNGYNTNHNLH